MQNQTKIQKEISIHVRLAELNQQIKAEPLILTLKKPGDSIIGEVIRYESECNTNHFLVIQHQRGTNRLIINKSLKQELKNIDAKAGDLISIVFIGKIKMSGYAALDGFKAFKA